MLRAPGHERRDGFGTTLALTGTSLLVGQRDEPLHVFELGPGGKWSATRRIDGEGVRGVVPRCTDFGYCGADLGLTLAAEGDWLLVGAPGRSTASDPGAVHVYGRDADGRWVHREPLKPKWGAAGDRFGAVIAFTPHGVLIGAPGADAAALVPEGHVARRLEARSRHRVGRPGPLTGEAVGVVIRAKWASSTPPLAARSGAERRLGRVPLLRERHRDRDQHAGGALRAEVRVPRPI